MLGQEPCEQRNVKHIIAYHYKKWIQDANVLTIRLHNRIYNTIIHLKITQYNTGTFVPGEQ